MSDFAYTLGRVAALRQHVMEKRANPLAAAPGFFQGLKPLLGEMASAGKATGSWLAGAGKQVATAPGRYPGYTFGLGTLLPTGLRAAHDHFAVPGGNPSVQSNVNAGGGSGTNPLLSYGLPLLASGGLLGMAAMASGQGDKDEEPR